MGQRRKQDVTRGSAGGRDVRAQEVVRANRELAAYFKGRRTEREARAALKIIKAFVRDRERTDERRRPPLPGADLAVPKEVTNLTTVGDGAERQIRRRRRSDEQTPE
jgi:hypothetical protein